MKFVANQHFDKSPSSGRRVHESIKVKSWKKYCGNVFEHKCLIEHCQDIITARKFEAGHITPYSRGGESSSDNIIPLCSKCNKEMGDMTLDEYNDTFIQPTKKVVTQKSYCLFYKKKNNTI